MSNRIVEEMDAGLTEFGRGDREVKVDKQMRKVWQNPRPGDPSPPERQRQQSRNSKAIITRQYAHNVSGLAAQVADYAKGNTVTGKDTDWATVQRNLKVAHKALAAALEDLKNAAHA